MNLLKFLKKREIKGCFEREVYLTRYFIINNDTFAIYLHHFHKSDEGTELHDHPRSFFSLILWGGYWEHRFFLETDSGILTYKKWIGPGRFIFRQAETLHRVELPKGKSCWTLVFLLPRYKRWGFLTDNGYVDAETRLRELDCE
jgi:hypothetical protein